jgi:hypothetical protein
VPASTRWSSSLLRYAHANGIVGSPEASGT